MTDWTEPPSLEETLWAYFTPAFSDTDDGTLQTFINSFAIPFLDAWQIAHSRWEDVFDADHAPVSALDYLSQFVGVELPAGADEATRRELIRGHAGFNRGTVAAIVAATKLHLTGRRTVVVMERVGGAPYQLAIRTRTGETPDADVTLADILSQKPAGIILDYEAVPGVTFAELEAGHPTFADVEDDYATFGDVKTSP